MGRVSSLVGSLGPRRWIGIAWTVFLILRLTVGGSSINFFTNWDALLYAVFYTFCPRSLDFMFIVPVVNVGGLVAILSTVIFVYGSTVFETALEEHGEVEVHILNIIIHILPWLISLYYAVFHVQMPREYAHDAIVWGTLLPSLLLPLAYMGNYDPQEKYGTQLPMASIWLVSFASVFANAAFLELVYRRHRPGSWAKSTKVR